MEHTLFLLCILCKHMSAICSYTVHAVARHFDVTVVQSNSEEHVHVATYMYLHAIVHGHAYSADHHMITYMYRPVHVLVKICRFCFP